MTNARCTSVIINRRSLLPIPLLPLFQPLSLFLLPPLCARRSKLSDSFKFLPLPLAPILRGVLESIWLETQLDVQVCMIAEAAVVGNAALEHVQTSAKAGFGEVQQARGCFSVRLLFVLGCVAPHAV